MADHPGSVPDGPVFEVRAVPANGPVVAGLLRRHLAFAEAETPPEGVFAVAPSSSDLAGMSYWAAFVGDIPVGCIALKVLEPGHGEIKSMHTVTEYRGRGVAAALLLRVEEARRTGMTRVSLETGSTDAFRSARRLYARHGYADCAPFGAYVDSPTSVCMSRRL